MTRLELYDTVVLKSDRQLVATVARTYHDAGHDQPLLDCLIVAHVPVQDTALALFIKSGYPPPDHVFIEFADQAQGSSLVHQDDVELLDRSFTLGDVVKREGSQMLGSVINIAELYTLQPVWRKRPDTSADGYNLVLSNDPSTRQQHTCKDECPTRPPSEIYHPQPSELILNVPGQELKKAADALEGDYVLRDDWLGVIEDIVLSITVMTDDGSIVVVDRPGDLYIPLPDFGDKPLVSLPEFDPDVPRPDVVVAQSGFSTIPLPPDDYQSGQYVIAGKRNLKAGRWLRGQYNPNCSPRVLVLDARANQVDVRWLTYNAFIPDTTNGKPSSTVELYENIETFPSRQELRRDRDVVLIDQAKVSRDLVDRRRTKLADAPKKTNIVPSSDIRVGDHVKFRDQAGAAVKYQGALHDGVVHNRFERLTSTEMLGFDMNELKVMCSQQEVSVLWQDGTKTQQLSRTIKRFSLFESDLAPTDIVVAREGMQQRPVSISTSAPEGPWTTFNEMAFFEKQHDLKPRKVGVVQCVDPVERVAQIRWFANPNIELSNSGHILRGKSRFGSIQQTTEDVSLFEVMKFPALERRLKDMVMIVPKTPCDKAVIRVHEKTKPVNLAGTFSLSSIRPTDMDFWLQHTAHSITSEMKFHNQVNLVVHRPQLYLDWIGDIVSLGLDGTVTVRVNATEFYQDVLIEHDQIICFIDEAAITAFEGTTEFSGTNSGTSMDLDDESEDYESEESDEEMENMDDMRWMVQESIEYEGGRRLDDDSDNENWEDADDDDDDDDDEVMTEGQALVDDDLVQGHSLAVAETEQDQSISEAGAQQGRSTVDIEDAESSLSQLQASLSAEEPQVFEILEREPPSDQFRLNAPPPTTSNSVFLKRIAKEQRLLRTSLPPGEIYVRTYERRLDLLRCLIIGPRDTPYEFAPFLIDLHLGPNFPSEPPKAHFHSWTGGLGRVNPNLYEEGKICLSLLGTWQGQSETEGWSEKATLLQLLVSLQGLVFVSQPFYNEAGFEGYAEDGAYKVESQRYTEKVFVMSRRFVKYALQRPIIGLEDVLAWKYLSHGTSPGLLKEIISRSNTLIESSRTKARSDNDDDNELMDGTGLNGDPTKVFLKPLSRGAVVLLEKTIRSLESMVNIRGGGMD